MKPAPGVCTDGKVLVVKAAASEGRGRSLKADAWAERPIGFTADPGRLLLDPISRRSARGGDGGTDGGTDGGAASGFRERG